MTTTIKCGDSFSIWLKLKTGQTFPLNTNMLVYIGGVLIGDLDTGIPLITYEAPYYKMSLSSEDTFPMRGYRDVIVVLDGTDGVRQVVIAGILFERLPTDYQTPTTNDGVNMIIELDVSTVPVAGSAELIDALKGEKGDRGDNGIPGIDGLSITVNNIGQVDGSITLNTSDLENDGSDGVHPFITAEDVTPLPDNIVIDADYATDKERLKDTRGENTGNETPSTIGALIETTELETITDTTKIAGSVAGVVNWFSGLRIKEFLSGFFQSTLVSGTNIKTVNNSSLVGSGNVVIASTGAVVATSRTGIEGQVLDSALLEKSLPYNVTNEVPLTAGTYYTATTARAAVPSAIRTLGKKITYVTSAGVWIEETFVGTDVSEWGTGSNWVNFTAKSVRDAKIANSTNIFMPSANATKIAQLEKCILDMSVIGLNSSNRYYLDEFGVNDNSTGYKIGIRDSADVIVMFANFIYTAPTTYPQRNRDIITVNGSGVYVTFTINWDEFISLIYNETTLASSELNNKVIIATDSDKEIARKKIGVNDALDVYNVSVKVPLQTGYYTIDTAIAAVPVSARKLGLKITYATSSEVWVENRFIGADLSSWLTSTKWKETLSPTNLVPALASNNVLIDNMNQYDSSLLTLNKIIKTGSTYTLIDSNYYQVTGFMPIDSERIFLYSGCTAGAYTDDACIALFSDKTDASYITAIQLSALTGSLKDVAIANPTAKYVKFTLRKIGANDGTIFNYYRYPILDPAEKASINSKLLTINQFSTTLKINMMGDSYTELGYDDNRGFLFYAAKMLGIQKSQIGNYGIGGNKISRTSASDTDSSIMVNRYNLMSDCDLLCIMGGYNDANAPFSDWSSKLGSAATKIDKTTIWGAFSCIIEEFMSVYPYSKTQFAVMTYPYAYDDIKKELNSTIRSIADYYNITLIDFEKKCGFVHGFNCQLVRDNLIAPYSSNWVDGFRPRYQDGITILSDSEWSYIPDFISRPVNSKTLSIPINCNLHQYHYNGSTYDWISESNSREATLEDNCTHIRIAYYTSFKNTATIRITDGTVVDYGDIHPNIFGFKRMAPVFAESVKSILIPSI